MSTKDKNKSLNPSKEQLSVEKLKTFSGFENISDKDAEEIVFAIQTFAIILHDLINHRSEPNEMNKAA